MSNASSRRSSHDRRHEDDSIDGGDPSPEPSTINSDDVLTDPPVQRYQYRHENLSNKELPWFQRLKMFKRDEQLVASTSHDPRPLVTGRSLVPTNAFGKLKFTGRELKSWYVRLAHDTDESIIQELLVAKLKVLNSESNPLRIYCIDFDQWPQEDLCRPRPKSEDLNKLSIKLQSDFQTMCRDTVGIILTWSGLGGDNLVHLVLEKISQLGFERNFAILATPPWNALNHVLRLQLQKEGKTVSVDAFQTRDQDRTRHISPYASHFLFLDEPHDSSRLRNMRYFHKYMIEAMEAYQRNESSETPVICILVNGYHDALRMVVNALLKKIPVLVIKGSGGYADIIAEVYENAESSVVPELDESGCVRTRIWKRAGPVGMDYLENKNTKHHLLEKIFNKLDYLTIYDPCESSQTLDQVFFQALLKHNRESEISWLVGIMQKFKNMRRSDLRIDVGDEIEPAVLMVDPEAQVNFFLEALKQNSVGVVKLFLKDLKIHESFEEHFLLSHIRKLFDHQGADIPQPIKEARRKLEQLFQLPILFTADQQDNRERQFNPIQELFLWAVLTQYVDMAVVFWEICEDKIVSALVAQNVLHCLARAGDNVEQMEGNAKRFQGLAEQTVKDCHNMSYKKTELLLMKSCPWWGNVSVLSLVLEFGNKKFMAQTACEKIMTRIWRAKPPSYKDHNDLNRPCQLVWMAEDAQDGSGCCNFSPLTKYVISFITQIIFLVLFSVFLLFDMNEYFWHLVTVLSIWVASIFGEEIRQIRATDPVGTTACCRRMRTYLEQGWNKLDLATIICFLPIFLLFSSNGVIQFIGRILLAVDVFLFYMRIFQMLMVFKQLGLMLFMAYKMLTDTAVFMGILMIVVVAYAVASESLLCPRSDLTGLRIFNLLRKAYWQVFGELLLEEIESEEGSCPARNSSMLAINSTVDNDLHVVEKYNTHAVAVLMGFYVMITHVLLLNLLIARFGVTFKDALDDATELQSWHRCQIRMEYYKRTSWPPPLNIPYFFFMCWQKFGSFLKECCRGRPREENDVRMNDLRREQERLLTPAAEERNVSLLKFEEKRAHFVLQRENKGHILSRKLKEQTETLKKENAAMQSEIGKLRKDVKKYGTDVFTRIDQNLNQLSKFFNENLTKAEQEKKDATKKLATVEAEKAAVQKQLMDSEQKVSELEHALEQQKIQQLSDAMEQQSTMLQGRLTEISTDIQAVKEQQMTQEQLQQIMQTQEKLLQMWQKQQATEEQLQ